MRCSPWLRIAVVLVASAWPSSGSAAEFVIAGPRAMGMGGAGVAVTTNALATYWNPAGLAMTQTVDIRAQGGGMAIDRLGMASMMTAPPMEAPVAHKFEIHKDKAGEFRVRFKYNSEVIFSTEGYSSKASAKAAIESIKKNTPGAEVDDTTD